MRTRRQDVRFCYGGPTHFSSTLSRCKTTTSMRQSITVSVIQKQKRQKWTAPEDALLFELIMDKHGLNWTAVAEDMPMRTGKQCRER